jgi:hypothetical protein
VVKVRDELDAADEERFQREGMQPEGSEQERRRTAAVLAVDAVSEAALSVSPPASSSKWAEYACWAHCKSLSAMEATSGVRDAAIEEALRQQFASLIRQWDWEGSPTE